MKFVNLSPLEKVQGPQNDMLSEGTDRERQYDLPEKIKFNISETVVNTSYFSDYSKITKHWLY